MRLSELLSDYGQAEKSRLGSIPHRFPVFIETSAENRYRSSEPTLGGSPTKALYREESKE